MNLVNTKMYIPIIRTKVVRRLELYKKLNQVLNYRVCLITAPAGFGKTTLLASWINSEQKDKSIITWLSLDEEDNTPKDFWSYFLMCFSSITPEAADMIGTFTSSYKNNTISYKTCVPLLINYINSIPKQVIFVLDDFQFINDAEIFAGLRFLLKHMPQNMHLVISARVLPDLELAKLIAEEGILLINQNALSFNFKETKELFSNVMGAALPEDKILYFNNETEGWAAGLQMIALSMKNSKKDTLNTEFESRNPFVFNYLAEEVFKRLNKQIKKFLLYTCLLDQFSYELCDYLMDNNQSKRMIENIDALNLFIIGLDNDKKWFRYHNIFRSFLKERLEKEYGTVINHLYERAAMWYEDNGKINNAIVNFIKANQFDKAILHIENISAEMLCNGQAILLNRWNEMLPNAVVFNNTRLILNSAWAVCIDGTADEIAQKIQVAEKHLECTSVFGNFDPAYKAEISALSVMSIIGLDKPDWIIENCKNALPFLGEKHFLNGLVIFKMANALLMKGELLEGILNFERCLQISKETGDIYIAILANKSLAIAGKWQGNFDKVEQNCKQLISLINQRYSMGLDIEGLIYSDLSDVCYQRNNLEDALELAKKGLELGQTVQNTWVLSENYYMLAKTYHTMGMEKEREHALYMAQVGLEDERLFDIRMNVECLKAEISLQKGDSRIVSVWLEKILPKMKDGLFIIYPRVYLIHARYLIFCNEFSKAREVIEVLRQRAEKYNLKGLYVEILILSSIVFDYQAYSQKAIGDLKKAIELSADQKQVRVFLEEGERLGKNLKKLKKLLIDNGQNVEVQFINLLLQNLLKGHNNRTLSEEVLSGREIEILQLIQQGAANSEISEKLFLSINTVKTHLLNIYTKLEVHNRTGALAKAKELNLI